MVHAKPLRRGQGQAPLLDLGQDAHHHKQLGALRWFQVKPVVKEPVAERIGVAAAGRAAAACVAHCHLATFDQRMADQHPIIVVRAALFQPLPGCTTLLNDLKSPSRSLQAERFTPVCRLGTGSAPDLATGRNSLKKPGAAAEPARGITAQGSGRDRITAQLSPRPQLNRTDPARD